MFEITGADIAALSDGDLRGLIILLCEADLRCRGLSTAAVTAGGNQDAADGGVDVRVTLPPGTSTETLDYVPRPATVFQSKASDMTRNAILREMRPGDTLRPAIVALAEEGGAYIIVSPGADLTDSMLTSRKSAMKEALRGLPTAAALAIDFYDRARIATWVRDHPGLIPWVRERIGKALRGWRSFGRWSSRPADADAGYLIDDAVRIRMPGEDVGHGLGVADGIERIRAELREPGKAVRLVGLSGVGKTRLAEALFDSAVGQNSLDPSLAIYADTADEPAPSPGSLASDLIAGRTRAILVIDNCPPETHRRLTEIVTAPGGTVSLLTIEYDIQDGEPEETAVFELTTSSLAVIEQLVTRRYPTLSEVDTRNIAEFSGGNARIALALASRDPRRGSFAGLDDRLLFERLFWQRNDPDTSLLAIAQVCALLYSFDGETLEGDAAELPILSGLIGRTVDAVYAAAAELKRRQLLQARTRWRAVLPHAVANRLAAIALQDIPRQRLAAALVEGAPDRVLRSFSRRLSYLDASPEAREIVQAWLVPGGLLADIRRLNDLGITVLTNVAPVAPEAVLSALEVAMHGADDHALRDFTPFARLMRALAYEPAQFERAVALLVRLARLPKENRLHGDAAEILESLFPIRLSGTLAPMDLRLAVVSRLLRSADEAEQRLGVRLLGAVLRTDGFSSWHGFEFGARSRGYGLYPRNGQEVRDWYAAVLERAEPFLTAEGAVADGVRSAVAQAFRGLWLRGGQAAALTRLAHAVNGARGLWRDGWMAVRQTRIYGGEQLTPDALAELGDLEDVLRPQTVADKVRSVVLQGGRSLDLDDLDDPEDDFALAMDRQAAAIARLAREVIADEAIWRALLPEVAAGDGYKVVLFGDGLATAAGAPRAVWAALVEQTAALPTPGISVLCGFLQGIERRDRALVRALLDEVLEDPILAPWLPVLQAGTTPDEAALARLHRVLASGVAPIGRFSRLAHGDASSAIPGSELARLLLQIAESQGGGTVSRDILYMRIYVERSAGRAIDPDLVEAGRTLLMGFRFARGPESREDYELALLARVSLAGEGGRAAVQKLGRALALAMSRYEVGLYDYNHLILALFEAHPTEMLDALFAGDGPSPQRIAHLLTEFPHLGKHPMGAVSDDLLLAWCECAPAERYPLAASFAMLFAQSEEGTPPQWTGLAGRLLTQAPDPVSVFETIVGRLHPTSWSGSLAEVLSSRKDLLDRLDIAGLPTLAEPLGRAREALRVRVDRERQRELDEDRERDGRFE